MTIQITEIELNTILAGLRLLQTTSFLPCDVDRIATGDGEHRVMDDDDIDELAERLNCG